jgi:protein-S-isoprenylcysteine O-methyltransferase Ste14
MTTIIWLYSTAFPQSIVILYPGVFVYWFIIHNNIEWLRKSGTQAHWVAVGAWLVTAGPLLILRRQIFPARWSTLSGLGNALQAAGTIALILAVVFMWSAAKQIPLRTVAGLPEIEPQKNKQPILKSGIYSKTRNPIYIGHVLLVFSAAAVSGFAANWILLTLDCIVLPVLIAAEERELLERYGSEYKMYMSHVPRFFPKLR